MRNRADAEAWEEFVSAYTPLIRRVAIARGMQDADANEIVQDVLLAIIKAMPAYQQKEQVGSFRKWLTTIARNKAINRIARAPRENERRAESFDLSNMPASLLYADQAERELENQWRQQLFVLAAHEIRTQVQPLTWSAFWMSAVEDRSCESVAKELGMSLGSVYVARSRVLAKIREWVRSYSAKWEVEPS
jgi:RNA polymerase sigma-70 factor (ECF subfamily)